MKNLNMISRRSFLKAALAASAVSAMALTGCGGAASSTASSAAVSSSAAASGSTAAAAAEQLLGTMSDAGVLLLSKPFSNTLFLQAIHIAAASNHRLLRLRQENAKMQEKIAQVRLVSRAKCCLIEREGMTETDAHRLIENT